MDKIDILLTIMIASHGLILTLMLIVWRSTQEIREDVKDIDRRLCRIEGAMASKECCMLKDHRNLEKAE